MQWVPIISFFIVKGVSGAMLVELVGVMKGGEKGGGADGTKGVVA